MVWAFLKFLAVIYQDFTGHASRRQCFWASFKVSCIYPVFKSASKNSTAPPVPKAFCTINAKFDPANSIPKNQSSVCSPPFGVLGPVDQWISFSPETLDLVGHGRVLLLRCIGESIYWSSGRLLFGITSLISWSGGPVISYQKGWHFRSSCAPLFHPTYPFFEPIEEYFPIS